MAGLGRILSRIFFWSYERGTWHYDVAVILILIFVFFAPWKWLNDQPQYGQPAGPEQVKLVDDSENGHRQIYQVDARVLAPPEQTPALQNDLHNALQRALPQLHNGRFSITKIDALRDENGTVSAYEVEIRH